MVFFAAYCDPLDRSTDERDEMVVAAASRHFGQGTGSGQPPFCAFFGYVWVHFPTRANMLVPSARKSGGDDAFGVTPMDDATERDRHQDREAASSPR